jgi:hydrogenase nickel incorporation protein HypA/HybF
MHELSIALSIVEVAAEELARQGGGVVEAVHLKLGPLSGVIKEALLSAWELACEGSPIEGAKLAIRDVPVEIMCPTCGQRRAVASIQMMQCVVCGTPSADVVHGRELEVTAMEICDVHHAPG